MRGITHAVVTSKQNRNNTTVYVLRNDTAGIQTPKRLRLHLTRDYLMAEGD